ncbi:MAG TPA: cbb3-type cytochrome c oxidase subunit I [Flavitalea sp.]|nr:cbb3-type cytochrome c oxidase subunit I [Flavitalea sp.]
MDKRKCIAGIFSTIAFMTAFSSAAQSDGGSSNSLHPVAAWMLALILAVSLLLVAVWLLKVKTKQILFDNRKKQERNERERFEQYMRGMDSRQIEAILTYKRRLDALKEKEEKKPSSTLPVVLTMMAILSGSSLFAQAVEKKSPGFSGEAGMLITIFLILIPILAGISLMVVKVINVIRQYRNEQSLKEAEKLARYLNELSTEELEPALLKRKAALDFKLSNTELSGNMKAEDDKGIINVSANSGLPVVALKKRAQKRPNIDPALSKLILWYIGSATFWLLFGSSVGEYLGIKFVAPDADHVSWLSFGRLRPVHTNSVFWGWASLGMLGLGYYIVPRVSNTPLASIKNGWYALHLINASVAIGTVSLMAGVNNGGGEFREYIWPIMLLFGIGLTLSLINFLQTIARRKTKEIYISNWYMTSAIIFALVISVAAYVPLWQDGLGETIIQGYYMHQGVGMWFMFFTLGIVYYFLPQQLNKPIYSYSLGILAFWTQILFYTLIGTHHFVFSSIPWWLQTVAIVGSAGMIIPVVAGTANFLLTFNGAWYKIAGSYTLPFFLVGIIFYFTGSMQGTAEAFRSTNLIWHFTDFTVAHSHLTMYGIICFFLWAGIYAVIPRLTGKEAPQITVGAHFWLALIGLLFYTIPLMYGGTLKGLMWMDGKPFMESVILMAPYWLWRAIGGSFMWLSHLFFAYNIYKMLSANGIADIREAAVEKLKTRTEAVAE